MAPLGEPGVLRIRAVPRVPATARDSRPRGETRRMASARPGASRSSTIRVPSGVRSRGPKPVPPVVTISPAKPVGQLDQRLADVLAPVGHDPVLDHGVALGGQPLDQAGAAPVLAGRRPPRRRTR